MTTSDLVPATPPIWDDARRTPSPRLVGDVTADACVVGLGASGLAAIRELQRQGLRVAGVDARDVGGGAAGHNGGFLLAGLAAFYHDAVHHLGHARARAIYALTLAELDRVFAARPDVARRTGSLRIAWSAEEERDCDRQLAALRADGFPVEPYEGLEGRGLLLPSDGVFNPLARCRAMAAEARAAGAHLFGGSRVHTVAGHEVTAEAGRVRCERVIVAVDGALERLLPELAGRVRTARLQMIATAPTTEVTVPRPVYARWGLEYWQQLDDGRIALGGFRDAGGDAEWTTSIALSVPVQAALERFLRESLGVRAPVTHRWASSVSYTRTLLPVLAEVRPRVWACGGYSGTGNVIGTICGRAAAELATGGRSALAEPFLATA